MFSVAGEQQERVAHAIHLKNILAVRSCLDQKLDPHSAMLRVWRARANERVRGVAQSQISRENEFLARRIQSTQSTVDNHPHWSFGHDCKTTKLNRALRLQDITRENKCILHSVETAKPCVDFRQLDLQERDRQTELDRKLRQARNYRRQINLRVKPLSAASPTRPQSSSVEELMKLITKYICLFLFALRQQHVVNATRCKCNTLKPSSLHVDHMMWPAVEWTSCSRKNTEYKTTDLPYQGTCPKYSTISWSRAQAPSQANCRTNPRAWTVQGGRDIKQVTKWILLQQIEISRYTLTRRHS